jgi:hypothetical protein
MQRSRVTGRGVRFAVAAVALVALVVPAAADPAFSPPPAAVAYRLTFTGSGTATSDYPPVASDTTVFTSTIAWKLIYDVTIDFPLGAPGSPWRPARGSAVEGSSTGVAAPGGLPIEEGCDRIGFSLDASQPGSTFVSRKGRVVDISLTTPGFESGALLVYSPGQCANPFPLGNGGPGCPAVSAVDSPTVSLDATRAKQSWTFKEQCDVPEQGQTAHWSGTLTATRQPLSVHFSGHTAQRCSKWDSNCAAGTRLTVSFDLFKGVVSHFTAQDEGRCNLGKQSQGRLTPPSGKIDAGGRFHLAYTANAGAYHADVRGQIQGRKVSGILSSTERFNATSGYLDPHGTIRCRTTNVHWTATGAA